MNEHKPPQKSMAPNRLVAAGKIFTVEIEGKAIVSFEAESTREAAGLLKEHWFRSDLQSLTSSGAPLWDGAAGLRCRPASQTEIDRYRSMVDAAAEEAGDLFLAFVVTLDGKEAGALRSDARCS